MTQRLVPLLFHRMAYDTPFGRGEFLLAPPPPDLAGIVTAFWISRGHVTFLQERILPQNNIELMFNLEQPFAIANRPRTDRRFRRAWVAGMQRDWLLVTPDYPASDPSYLLSARMPPLGAYRVLGVPMNEMTDEVIELDETLGPQVNAVHERLANTRDPGMQLAILCDFVRQRIARSRIALHADARAAVAGLESSHGAQRIEPLCRQLRISRKHMRELMLRHVGLTPKQYGRMFRFRHVVDSIQSRRSVDLAQLAADCGYFDQSHFNRDFREFAGITPSEFATAGSTDGLTIVTQE